MSTAERRHLARETPSEGVDVARAEGSYVYDTRGKKYVDFLVGWCVGNFGWNNPRLRSRVRLTTQDSTLMLLPALTIERAAAKRGLDILESSLAS